MSATSQYAEVAVTLPVAGLFHYRVPAHLAARARVGARVLVRFGPRKVTGVVVREGGAPPEGVSPVDLGEVLDEEPALSRELVDLCLWIAEYYEAPPGEVMRAALPAGSGVVARGVIAMTEAGRAAYEGQGAALAPKQRALLARLAAEDLPEGGLRPAERAVVEALVAQRLVERREQRGKARARLRRERVARLAVDAGAAREQVARAPKRWAVVEALAGAGAEWTAVAALEQQVPGAKVALRELFKAGLVEITERELPIGAASVNADADPQAARPPVLTAEQAFAVAEIVGALAKGPGDAEPTAAADAQEKAAASDAAARPPDGAAASDAAARIAAGAAAADVEARPSDGAAASDAAARIAAGAAASDVEARPPDGAAASDVAARIADGAAASDAAARTPAGAAAEGVEARPPDGAAASDAAARPPDGAAASDAAARIPAGGVGGAPAGAVGGAPAGFTPFLLHGVTGSGKTEVYLQVIARALARGKTALVLVPEISLTPQLAARFRARFGDLVAILHSGLTETARLGEWSRLRRGEARIAVGARSAVFAPLSELGVIVVDEEHDGSFKQDEGVRYHARDVALVRAQRAGAVCVLGSATPSLESAAHAEPAAAGEGDAARVRGRYRKLVLTERPTARPMPAVEIIDLRKYQPDGDAMLSAPLRAAIGETLAAGDQTILFLNRRGFATFVLCRACGHAFRCPHCSVSLTYHRHSDRLSCHYCGFQQRVPEICPGCGTTGAIERKGLGTEKVADAVAESFPGARVSRLDRDVASGSKIEAVLARVARREIDILVGTQMVTKGHDFPGVTLVGVLCADTGLNLPDFRASERTFQLLAQVAGRAGRGDRPGRVLIQTYRPAAPAVLAAAAHDYGRFFAAEIAARADLGYPPHGRLIAVRIDGPDPHEVAGTAQRLAQLAEVLAGRPDVGGRVEVRGPVPAPLERLRGRTRWQVWLRSADRHALRRVARGALAAEVGSSVRVGLDVDPMSAL